ncbi:hypothetical protein BKA70DRAFT_1321507 [Coprinopsis sp. MPI-PUGE-AT-0042]|nr:hypothetical protein BKA70DRAFT_1321507 [Coprinopsis sp. MPI-PUGE-AT-0042]
MSFVRTMTFIGHNLGKNATLLLTFDNIESNPGMYSKYYPTAFKVVGFGATGVQSTTVTYKNQLVFLKPQVDQGNNIVSSGVFEPIKNGEQTDLITTHAVAPKTYGFTSPIPSSEGASVTAHNKTGEVATIAMGCQDAKNPDLATPFFIFKDIQNDSSVTCQFQPLLRGYFTDDFQENEVLNAEVPSAEAFKQDLEKLPEETTWVITNEGGKLAIKRG